MITVDQYFMGRREEYPFALTPQIEKNAVLMVELANKLLDKAVAAGFEIKLNPGTGSPVSSGWRPPQVNANTKNASPTSKHMTAEAIDIYDPGHKLDGWLMTEDGQAAMAEIGLWHEHPASTKEPVGWAHVQCKPPPSGRRTFYA